MWQLGGRGILCFSSLALRPGISAGLPFQLFLVRVVPSYVLFRRIMLLLPYL